jgi:hypothetical protein
MELRGSNDNEVFREWCDAVMACQYDRGLKTTLTPIVAKLSDMRIVNGELESLVFGPPEGIYHYGGAGGSERPAAQVHQCGLYAALMHTVPGQTSSPSAPAQSSFPLRCCKADAAHRV